jgi:hypothetical protein
MRFLLHFQLSASRVSLIETILAPECPTESHTRRSDQVIPPSDEQSASQLHGPFVAHDYFCNHGMIASQADVTHKLIRKR